MTFIEAMVALGQGHKVRRKGSKHHLYKDGDIFRWSGVIPRVSAFVQSGGEWELYEEPGHDFKWALERLKEGKQVIRKGLFSSQARGLIDMKRGKDFYPQLLFKPAEIEATDWILYERK